MMGCRRLALDKSKIIQAKAEMGWADSQRDVEPGVAVVAAVAASAQGYSYIDERSPGMGSRGCAGGGGAGDDRESKRSIGAGALGTKRQRFGNKAPTRGGRAGRLSRCAYTASRRGATSAGAGYGLGSGSGTGHGSGYGYGAWAGPRYGAGAGVGGGTGAVVQGGEDSRHSKRARASGGTSASGSDGSATDCIGGSVSRASFSDTEDAPGAGAMACTVMPTEQSWKGEDDEDDDSGGRGGDGGGGGSLDGGCATAKGSGDWHAEDSGKWY